MCQSLQASSNAIAAGLCVDNIFALIYFPLSSALSSGRPDAQMNTVPYDMDGASTDDSEKRIMNPLDIGQTPCNPEITASNAMALETVSGTIAYASVITWLGETLGGSSGALPVSTLLSILFTTVFPGPTSKIRSTGETFGTSLLYLFFATAGAPGISIADSVKSSFLPIGTFLLVLYGIHAIILVSCRYAAKKLWFLRHYRIEED